MIRTFAVNLRVRFWHNGQQSVLYGNNAQLFRKFPYQGLFGRFPFYLMAAHYVPDPRIKGPICRTLSQ